MQITGSGVSVWQLQNKNYSDGFDKAMPHSDKDLWLSFASLTKPHPPIVMTKPYPSTVMTKPHPPIVMTKPHPPIVMTKPHPPIVMTKPHPPTVMTKPHPPTVMTKPHPPTVMTKPHPPTVMTKPHPSTVMTKPYQPTVNRLPGSHPPRVLSARKYVCGSGETRCYFVSPRMLMTFILLVGEVNHDTGSLMLYGCRQLNRQVLQNAKPFGSP